MRYRVGSGSVAALLIAVAGCTARDVVLDRAPPGYVEDVAARAGTVDWSRAATVTVDLSEFEFEPGSLVFGTDVPYRLVLRNAGDSRHTFVSDGFFKAIAAHRLISAEGEVTNPYIKVIGVPPGETKELQFVALRKGVYPFECTVFLHAAFGMDGEIAVQ